MKKLILASASIIALATSANAAKTYTHETIIVESKSGDIASAGSANKVSSKELEKYNYQDVTRALRSVPGIKAYTEDGYGNRPNIGLRGGKSERSTGITLMEDGILIAPAPYAAPSAYYFPKMERMAEIEVLRGPSAIKAGPITTSGAINLKTKPIADKTGGYASFQVGSNNSNKTNVNLNINEEKFAAMLNMNRSTTDGYKNLDGGGNTGFEINDFVGKFRYIPDPSASKYQHFEVKLGLNDEVSRETYLGLTDADFQATPHRRYAASQKDEFKGTHEQIQLTHYIQPNANTAIATTIYNNEFARNWYKLDKIGGTKQSAALLNATMLSQLKGDADRTSGDIDLKANNREYDSKGINTVVNFDKDNHQLELGLRYHKDDETRIQHKDHYNMVGGKLVLQTAGTTGDSDHKVNRATAFAGYISDSIKLGKFTVTPAVRYENIEIENVNIKSGGTQSDNSTDVVMPGASINYEIAAGNNIFAGVHKGFAAATSTSTNRNEKSINYEVGQRFSSEKLSYQIIGFFNDYSNLLGQCTASTGGDCTAGTQYDGGKVEAKGIEANFAYDISEKVNTTGFKVPVKFVYTYTDAEFKESFASDFSQWGTVEAGNKLPYVAENQYYVSIGLENEKFALELSANHQDAMNTIADGSQKTEDALTYDLAASYTISDNTGAFATVTNLTDETYIASRHPYGVRPGAPLMAYIGLKQKF
jgi:Fe(3+) dicitrate transport protein